MSVLYLLLPLALIVVLAAVLAYSWAARHGQFDDLTTPAMRMLHDEVDPGRPRDGSGRTRESDQDGAGPPPALTTGRPD